ncbi:MAG: DNA-binding protein [Bdellovibrionota bacterium]|jgi:probable addiction module antidote protein
MKLESYENKIKERLKDPDYAVEYLTDVLANESQETFLIALKDVIDARGVQISKLSEESGVTRQALYHLLSDKSNPTLTCCRSALP